MKNFMTKKELWFPLILLFALMSMIQGCGDEKEPIKSVDLRYRVAQDSYLMDAKGNLFAEDGTLLEDRSFSFVVKSTDSWEVFGSKQESWYQISPDNGKAGESCTVTISCLENTELDNRMDTINIKSDYWTGKQFVLTQKGTAYLNADNVPMLPQDGSAMTFDVLANQKWTAQVTEGDIWLSINQGTSGEGNGKVEVQATANSGEQRTGIVTLFDRNGIAIADVSITQDGVLLTPATPKNGIYFAIYEQAQELVIPVESNARWTVFKKNPADEDWFEFAETTFNGNAEIVIRVSEHTGSAVRTGTLVLSTMVDEGATPLVKEIRFKQANPKIPEVHNGGSMGTIWGPGGLMPGRYNFFIGPFDAGTAVKLFFIWNGSVYAELRFHLNVDGAMKTELSTTPYCNDVNVWQGNLKIPVDNTITNQLSFEIQEAVDANGNSWVYTEWILNGEVIAKATSDGITDRDGTSDNWKVPFSIIANGGSFQIGATGGSANLAKWEYVAPLVWGD